MLNTLLRPMLAGAVIACSASASELPPLPEFEAFVDGVMAGHQDAYHFAGAVVSVVADGAIYFQKGYGYADLDAHTPVDPERTLFRIGSVSKLFTWTAIMQLAEQGRIDLNADVNSYLTEVTIPDTFEEPITIVDLMNHTPGFEDRFIGLFSPSHAGDSLPDLLNNQMPARVRPPGVVTSYSNHGSAIAGLALANVSGEAWQDYINDHVLTPLHMNNTVLQQPPPEPFDANTAKGYANQNGLLVEQPFEFVPMAPAGAISATAGDMARFMLAHLQLGQLDGARILREDTAKQMQTRSFQNAPGINGMAHGFIEMSRNGHHIIGHTGDTIWFHTLWAIFPDEGVGIYASYNTNSGAQARTDLFETFVDRYFPPTDPGPEPKIDSDAVDSLRRFEGHYRPNRMAETTFEKLGVLMGGATVHVDDDGALIFRGERTIRMGEIEPLLFQEIDGSLRVRFFESEDGEITKLFRDDIPVFAYDRTPKTELLSLNLALLAIALPIMLSGAIAWPAGAFRRRKEEPAFSQAHLPGAAKWTAWAASVALLTFLIGFGFTMANPMQIAFGLPRQIPFLLCLPLIATALTYVAILFGLLFCVRRIASFWARVHYLAVVAACAVVVWQLHTWNLLGFRY